RASEIGRHSFFDPAPRLRLRVTPLSVSAAQSMSASLRKRPRCCVAAKRRYVASNRRQLAEGIGQPVGKASGSGCHRKQPAMPPWDQIHQFSRRVRSSAFPPTVSTLYRVGFMAYSARPSAPPDFRGGSSINLREPGIKAPEAAKTRENSYFRHRLIGLIDEPFRPLDARCARYRAGTGL